MYIFTRTDIEFLYISYSIHNNLFEYKLIHVYIEIFLINNLL